jgi:hypothetical protein
MAKEEQPLYLIAENLFDGSASELLGKAALDKDQRSSDGVTKSTSARRLLRPRWQRTLLLP